MIQNEKNQTGRLLYLGGMVSLKLPVWGGGRWSLRFVAI